MARCTSVTSVVCRVVIFSAFVALIIAHQKDADGVCDSGADCTRSRQRRNTCSGSTYTMNRLIDIIEQIESKGKIKIMVPTSAYTPPVYLNVDSSRSILLYLRKFINANDHFMTQLKWNYVCGQYQAHIYVSSLTKRERDDLAKMIIHGNDEKAGTETGVVLTERSGTVAAGHVITGISCGGFNRDTQLSFAEWKRDTSSHLDNLFFVTISGDMGQTSLQFYSHTNSTHKLFGPSGQWDDLSCPKMYSLNPPVSELTEAEVNGDMDGVILGTLIPMIKDRHWKLSRIFREYYQKGGIQVGNRWFSAANRAETFGELVSDVELEAQSKAFAEAYYPSHEDEYNGSSLPSLLPRVHEAVQTFYKKYVTCTKTKYTIQYFVKHLKELEREKGFGVVAMTRSIVSVSEYFKSSHFGIMLNPPSYGPKYTDHFSWYVLREMVTHGFSPSEPRRELGVIEAGGDVVAIGHVLAGIYVGSNRNTANTLYGATVAGSLAQVVVNRATQKTSDTMGATGTWDRSRCPPKYLLKKSIKSGQHTTRAELLGDIDGFVLGHRVTDWLKTDPGLKLSTALERYYGTDFIPVSSQVRFEQFKTYLDNSKLETETTNACKKIEEKKAKWYQFFVDTSYCKAAAISAVNEFYKTVPLYKDEPMTSYESEKLPDYRTLVAAYPGDKAQGGVISGADLRRKLAGSRYLGSGQAVVDSLRISYMLNKLFGHRIPKTQSHGSVIKNDMVYIYDLAALKTYLTQKYGAPETATSLSTLSGKSGILALDPSVGSVGSVGLWDGSKMHQTPDLSSEASNIKASLWTANGCTTQVDIGSCNFYKCINWAVHCGTSGYALGYGYRYCRRFYSLYDQFDADGKLWVNEVRVCFMEAVAPFHKGMHTCDTIKSVAFESHVSCYKKSKHFCKMASVANNTDALFNIYEPNELWDFWGLTAWLQLLDTLKYCKTHVSKSVMDDILKFIKSTRVKLQQSLSSKQQDEGTKTASKGADDSSKCVAYANAGDCRFYQCFHDKFPCSVFDTNHMIDFEFPLCEDLKLQTLLLDYKGEQWLKKTNQCLMQKLLPLYNAASVNCVELHPVMFDDRVDCLVNAGFCDVIDDMKNSFAVDRGTNLLSYPALLPDKPGLSMTGRFYFYNELSSFRRDMDYAKDVCQGQH